MKRQLEQQEALLQNQQAMRDQMNYLFEKGLIKQDPHGNWISVENI